MSNDKRGEIEFLSELVHKAYCKSYRIKHGKDYWTDGDYNKLTEEDKNYDRATVKVVLDACKLAHDAEIKRIREELSEERIAKSLYMTKPLEVWEKENQRFEVIEWEELKEHDEEIYNGILELAKSIHRLIAEALGKGKENARV